MKTNHGTRLQSAMEYLMTYGWAILVIAIVLGVLYYLGVFNGINTVPRAQPGTCSIFRPNGAGTSYDVNFQGECQSQLPEFVAQFNGQSSTILLPNSIAPTGALTIAFWMNPNPAVTTFMGITGGGPYCLSCGVSVLYNNPPSTGMSLLLTNSITSGGSQLIGPPPPGNWTFIAFTWNGAGQGTAGATQAYYNGQNEGGNSGLGSIVWGTTTFNIGSLGVMGSMHYYSGEIADFQLYNISLTQAEITALYQEGIGGAPVRPQNIVGWWPLNGNTQDYSGNNNNGQPTSVHYVSNWTSSYDGPRAG